jgi:hypothetical protein
MVKPPGFDPNKISAEILLMAGRKAFGEIRGRIAERGVVRCDRKLRGGDDQFPRLDWLWSEVYRLDQR